MKIDMPFSKETRGLQFVVGWGGRRTADNAMVT